MNVVVTADGRVGSLDTRAMTDARVHEFGAYFQAVLADELRRLGASVAYDAVATGMREGTDVVIVDTAGRLHTQDDLMAELTKVRTTSLWWIFGLIMLPIWAAALGVNYLTASVAVPTADSGLSQEQPDHAPPSRHALRAPPPPSPRPPPDHRGRPGRRSRPDRPGRHR